MSLRDWIIHTRRASWNDNSRTRTHILHVVMPLKLRAQSQVRGGSFAWRRRDGKCRIVGERVQQPETDEHPQSNSDKQTPAWPEIWDCDSFRNYCRRRLLPFITPILSLLVWFRLVRTRLKGPSCSGGEKNNNFWDKQPAFSSTMTQQLLVFLLRTGCLRLEPEAASLQVCSLGQKIRRSGRNEITWLTLGVQQAILQRSSHMLGCVIAAHGD